MRVIVTRPAEQSAIWVDALTEQGIDAVALPLIGVGPAADAAAVAAAWRQLEATDLAMFVSANAVRHFFDHRPAATPWPAATTAASTGPGTTTALSMAGVPLAQIVEPAADSAQFDSEALWQRLRGREWTDARALIVRGDGGRDWLADTLREHGAQVDFLSAYSRRAPDWGTAEQSLLDAALQRPDLHCWVFSSSEAIGHLAERLNALQRPLPPTARAIATHPKIAARAADAGFGDVRQSRPALADVIACIQSFAL